MTGSDKRKKQKERMYRDREQSEQLIVMSLFKRTRKWNW